MESLESLILKSTDEALLGEENWASTMQIVDSLSVDPNRCPEAMTILLRRLSNKSQNVIFVTLKVLNVLYKNCGSPFSQEIASKSLMNAFVRLYNDHSIHEKIIAQLCMLLYEWEKEFGISDPSKHIIHDTCNKLRSAGAKIQYISHKDEQPSLPPRYAATQKEEEDLQLALALSMAELESKQKEIHKLKEEPKENPTRSKSPQMLVKALYDFTAKEEDELGFIGGDLIEVLDSSHQDWWKGRLSGSDDVGLFPKSYTTLVKRQDLVGTSTDGNFPTAKQFDTAKAFSQEDIDKFCTIMDRMHLTSTASRYKNDPHLENLYHKIKSIDLVAIQQRLRIIDEQREELENLSLLLSKAIATFNYLNNQQQHIQESSVDPRDNYLGEGMPGPSSRV